MNSIPLMGKLEGRIDLIPFTFCDPTAGTGVSFQTDARTAAEEQTDVEVEIII